MLKVKRCLRCRIQNKLHETPKVPRTLSEILDCGNVWERNKKTKKKTKKQARDWQKKNRGKFYPVLSNFIWYEN